MKTILAALALSTALSGAAFAQDAARIALLHGLSGSPLEAYSKQTHTGFEMGLEYATGGPKELDRLYTRERLAAAFAGFASCDIKEYDAVIGEGDAHLGLSALVDLVGRK